MKFNPQKYYHLSIGKSSLPMDTNNFLILYDHHLQSVTSNPYFVVELQNDLKFNQHIFKIESEEKQLIGMLTMVLKDADQKTRKIADTSRVRPGPEYGCMVWDLYLTKDITLLK